MPLRLSQVQIFLPASAPFQDVQPGLGEIIGIIGGLSIPGSLLGYSTLQYTLEGRIVPAIECCRLRCIKGFIDAVVIEFFLPCRDLVSPALSLLTGQVRTQDRLRPGRCEITKKPAGLAVRVIHVLPLALVFFRDSLKD